MRKHALPEDVTKRVMFDLEGDNYLEDVTKVWCFSISDEEGPSTLYSDYDPDAASIKEGLKRLEEADEIVIHYGTGYDYWVMEMFYPGSIPREKVVDTVIIGKLKTPWFASHSLAVWGQRLGHKKGDFNDFSKYTKEMGSYNNQDTQVLQAIWKDCKDFYFNERNRYAIYCETVVAFCLAEQQTHGFRLDVAKAQILEATLREEKVLALKDLQEIFPPIVTERYSDKTGKRLKDGVQVFNPGSTDQIAERLRVKYGWKPTVFTPTGKAKVDGDVLKRLEFDEIPSLMRYLRVTKMLGQISDGKKGWLKLEKNGRLHGKVNSFGARTHRMSHSHPNVAQVDKEPAMRECFLPDVGDKLVGCDADGLELRMLAHFLGRFDNGAYAHAVDKGDKANETDVHNITKKVIGITSRDGAKTFIYAWLYGSGDANLGAIIKADAVKHGVKLTESNSALGKAARAKIETGIVGMDALIKNIKGKHNSSHNRRSKGAGRWLVGIDGRRVWSNAAFSSLNTLLQSSGAIVMKWALVHLDEEIHKAGFKPFIKYVANVHDEIQMTVHPDYAERAGQMCADAIRKAGVTLELRCPLDASYDIGDNWGQTH